MAKGRNCPSGKVSYRQRAAAAQGARRLARQLNQEGKIAQPMYCYRCVCGMLHLTRQSQYKGVQQPLVFQPVTEELQVELMDEHARAEYRLREERRRAEEADRVLRSIPELGKPAQPYANRPRNLRYR